MSSIDPTPRGYLSPARTVGELVGALHTADDHLDALVDGQPLSVLAHSLQCAALLRSAMPDDLELQVAGLVHDVGHVVVPGDDERHGRHGADFVSALLGERVATLVGLHVPAKRWLVTVDPHYRRRLTAASVRTLRDQGDEMDGLERRAFEISPHRRAAVALRRADEAAKSPGLRVPDLNAWVGLIEAVAHEHQAA